MLSVRNQHCSLLADGLRIFKGEKFTKFSSRHSSVSASKMENVQNAKYRLTYCIRAYGVAVLGCRASESFQRFIFPFPPNFSFFPKKEFQLESQQQSGKTFVHLFHKANALSYTHIQKWPNLWTDCTVLISQTVNFPFFLHFFFGSVLKVWKIVFQFGSLHFKQPILIGLENRNIAVKYLYSPTISNLMRYHNSHCDCKQFIKNLFLSYLCFAPEMRIFARKMR